jgi:hypothetical protein
MMDETFFLKKKKGLLFGGFPSVFWELYGDAQSDAYQGDQYDVGKVSAQNVVVEGESKQ